MKLFCFRLPEISLLSLFLRAARFGDFVFRRRGLSGFARIFWGKKGMEKDLLRACLAFVLVFAARISTFNFAGFVLKCRHVLPSLFSAALRVGDPAFCGRRLFPLSKILLRDFARGKGHEEETGPTAGFGSFFVFRRKTKLMTFLQIDLFRSA